MSPRRKRRAASRKRRLGWICALTGAGFVGAYLVLTSSAFLRAVILPRVSRALRAEISADHIQLRPFSRLTISGLAVTPPGHPTLLTLKNLQLRYRWPSLLKGAPLIDEVLLSEPVLHIERGPDGTTSLDPFLNTQPPPPGSGAGGSPEPPTTEPHWLINHLRLQDALIRYVDRSEPGSLRVVVSGLQVDLHSLGPQSAGTIQLGSQLDLELIRDGITNSLASTNHGSADFLLDTALLPLRVNGEGRHTFGQTSGRFAPLQDLALEARTRFASNRLESASLKLRRDAESLGEIRADGRADLASREVQLRLEIPPLPPATSALLLQLWKLDLGQPELRALIDLETYQQARMLNVATRLGAHRVAYRDANGMAPALDLDAAFSLTLDAAEQVLRIANFDLRGSQGSQRILHGTLTEPLLLSWRTGRLVPSSAGVLELGVDQLNLATWQPLLPLADTAGVLDLTLLLTPDFPSRGFHAKANGSIENFAANLADREHLAAQAFVELEAMTTDDSKVRFTGSAELNRATLTDLASRETGTPLNLRLDVAGTRSSRTLNLTHLQFQLPETPHTRPNTLTGTATLQAAGPGLNTCSAQFTATQLDLTPLWSAWPQPGNASRSPTPSPTPDAPPKTTARPARPTALSLPWTNTTFNLHVDELRVRDLRIPQGSARIEINPHEVRLAALQLALDEGNVAASVALEGPPPHWQAAGSLQMTAVQLQPWIDLLLPQYRGQARAHLDSDLMFQIADVTDAGWPRRLSGRGMLTATNAQLELFRPALRRVLLPIAQALRLPELTQSPLDWLKVRLTADQGRLQVDGLELQSSAFTLSSSGTLELSPSLTDTPLSLPLHLSLRRNLALTAGLITPAEAADTVYVRLPPFATVSGTLSNPQTDLDKRRLSGLLLRSGVGIAESLGADVDPKTGRILRAVSDILTATDPGLGGTNLPPTFSTWTNLLDRLKRSP